MGGTEGSTETVGTLRLGLNADAFPVIVMPDERDLNVLVAGSRFGAGRIVAFSGQDFLSPGTRATLLGNANAVRLLANAVRWAGNNRAAPLRVLVDNEAVAVALLRQGLSGANKVVGVRGRYRDWSADALDDVDVAVVLTNDWETAHLAGSSIVPLQEFVARGGGLIVAGSALHWSWWLEESLGPFPGDRLLSAASISWNENSISDIQAAATDFDPDRPRERPALDVPSLRVSASGPDFIEWSWTPVAGASGYDVQFSADEVFTDEDETVPRVGTELTYRREGLKPETDFWLRVRSVAGSGDDRQTSAWSASVPGMTAKTPPPPVPTGLRVTASGPDFIEWSWTPVAGVSGYDVQFSVNEALTDEEEIISLPGGQVSYRREGLAVPMRGYLRVRSVTGSGQDRITSLWSAPATGSTFGGPDQPNAHHHAELTSGLPARPFVNTTVGGTEGSTETVGTLQLGLNPDVFPVIIVPDQSDAKVLVAGSRLGAGRIVAFSGQDFLSPGTRATLLGHPSAVRLLANAVRWAGNNRAAPLRVLVDNERVSQALRDQGLSGVEVIGARGQYWSTDALGDAEVAVVLTNDWGTARLGGSSVAPLQEFVERGGGLIVAGSALHWSWWLEEGFGPFPGDLLLSAAGISWNEDSISDIQAATTEFDLALTPAVVWQTYVSGNRTELMPVDFLSGAFNAALVAGRTAELDAALVRLVRETPPLPVSADAWEARLAAEVASTLGPHEWPDTHPWAATFPGLPDRNARRGRGSVVVDATWGEFPADARRRTRYFPLGFYAPPGGLVTISVPPSHATGQLLIEASQQYDDLQHYAENNTTWRRGPALRRTFPVTATETAVTNAYGGSLALIVPEAYEGGRIPITVEGAIPMAVYTADRSTQTEWRVDLNAGAPQAIIQTLGGIRFVISADAARSISDPGEVAAFWDGFQRHHAELASEPAARAYESIWIFDPQVGWGYANADWDRINYPLHGEIWALLPGTAEGRDYLADLPDLGPQRHRVPPSTGYVPRKHGVDWWLFGHELGHQWQTEDWRGHGNAGVRKELFDITEVGVNLFTMYTLNYYVFRGDDFGVYTEWENPGCAFPVDHAALANQRWSSADLCEKLALYRQLITEFGWSPMRRVFQSYYDPAYPRATYGGHLDGFAIRFSAVVERDLVDFFRRWEYPLSNSAETTIRGFGYRTWLPPGW